MPEIQRTAAGGGPKVEPIIKDGEITQKWIIGGVEILEEGRPRRAAIALPEFATGGRGVGGKVKAVVKDDQVGGVAAIAGDDVEQQCGPSGGAIAAPQVLYFSLFQYDSVCLTYTIIYLRRIVYWMICLGRLMLCRPTAT